MNNPKTNKKPTLPPLRYLSPLHRASRQIQDHLRGMADTVGVAGSEGHLVSYLGSYAPVPVGDLMRVFGLRKSTLTGMLDRLETAGLIERTLNDADRRSFLVGLTPTGAAVAAQVRAQLESFEAALDGELSAGDRAAFKRLMAAIARVTAADRR
jgi:DNA-binding MarR family transcriptional regulator